MIISNCHRIVGGVGKGPALVSRQPINFLAMVDTKSGIITDPKHELYNRSLRSSVLFFPYAIGSSVGAYAIYSLKDSGSAPNAIVCTKADITTASGCAIANIPVVDLPHGVQLGTMETGLMTEVDARVEPAIVKI